MYIHSNTLNLLACSNASLTSLPLSLSFLIEHRGILLRRLRLLAKRIVCVA